MQRQWRTHWWLLAVDILGLLCAYELAHRVRLGEWIGIGDGYLLASLVALAVGSLYVFGAYRIGRFQRSQAFVLNSAAGLLVAIIASVVLAYLMGVANFSSLFGRGVFFPALVLFSCWSLLWRWFAAHVNFRRHGTTAWLAVCGREEFKELQESIGKSGRGATLQWFDIEDQEAAINEWAAANGKRAGVIYSRRTVGNVALMNDLSMLNEKGFEVLLLRQFYERHLEKLPLELAYQDDLARGIASGLANDVIGLRLKRLIDFLAGVTGLIVLWPVMAIVALAIRATSPGAIIYRQSRVGYRGMIFTLYKFRSMAADAESGRAQWAAIDDPRLTRIGGFLRTTRIDELPQLWNLVLGSMSLIGPRPERPEFVDRLKREIPNYELRLQVPPGITGWAQVMYRYGASVEDAKRKLEYDLYYIKNHSIRLDIAIAFRTVAVMLKGLGR